jgi:hypothetical protein
MKKLFVGGWPGCGSRVVQRILFKGGYHVGSDVNVPLDYWARVFPSIFNQLYFHGKADPIKGLLAQDLKNRDSWSIKQARFMWMIPLLKQWYPGSQFILMVRHPFDCVSNKHRFDYKYGGLSKYSSCQARLNYFGRVMATALKDTDFIVRLEDLCFKTRPTIAKLLEFAEIEDDARDYEEIIKMPKTFGRGQDFCGGIYHECLDWFRYGLIL